MSWNFLSSSDKIGQFPVAIPVMLPVNPAVARCCARSIRSHSRPSICASTLLSQHQRRTSKRRWQTTAVPSSPKVSGIVDQISQLTLLETADLVASLKVRFPAGIELQHLEGANNAPRSRD